MPSFPFVLPNLLTIPAATGLSASGNSAAASLPPRSSNMAVTVYVKFTQGSLTSAVVTLQVLAQDGSTWMDVNGAAYTTGTMTADTNMAITALLPGVKQFRCRYTKIGTATNSALVIDATVQQ